MMQAGAGYVIFTMMQRTRYLIAPNDTYDKLTGYKPGEACSTRDLVENLHRSLEKRGGGPDKGCSQVVPASDPFQPTQTKREDSFSRC
jgi:hypothetical protein